MDNFNKTDDLYDPNFSIDGSTTDKLDMYGVWLKQKKDLIEPIDDFSQTIDSTIDDAPESDMHFDDEFSFSKDFSDLDTEDDVLELEEFSAAHEDTFSAQDDEDTALNEDTFEALDLDDFLDDGAADTADTSDSFTEAEPIELDFAVSSSAEPPATSNGTAPAGLENFDEISLDDFEDAPLKDSTEDQDGLETLETVEEFDSLFESSEPENTSITKRQETSSFDIDITVDDEAHKVQHFEEISVQADSEETDISIFDAASDTKTETPFFDDIEAVEQDLLAAQPPSEPAAPAVQEAAINAAVSAAQEKATELLLQIAHEISDLKAELNSLKAGLAAQADSSAAPAAKPLNAVQEETADDSGNTGFFSDDDTDETIALTGDELNNILITADFTEEKSDDAELTDEYDIPEVLTQDIIPSIDETGTSDGEFEASITETEHIHHTVIESSENNALNETEGEKLLASDPVFNVEPAPITSLPDDLSYLDGELPPAEEETEDIDGVSVKHEVHQHEEIIEDAEPADEAEVFENIEPPLFDLPVEQEIQVPQAEPAETVEEAGQTAIELTETHTIHELQKDDDFGSPFADTPAFAALESEPEIIEEPFIEQISVAELKTEELVSAEDDEPIAAEPYKEEKPNTGKQETLLQAATQIINGERGKTVSIPLELKNEIKSVLAYMDQLLEALPEKKIEEFAKSEYFETYKHLFEELGIS